MRNLGNKTNDFESFPKPQVLDEDPPPLRAKPPVSLIPASRVYDSIHAEVRSQLNTRHVGPFVVFSNCQKICERILGTSMLDLEYCKFRNRLIH